MKLFQDHEGERVIMQCAGDKDLKVDGYIIGMMEGCLCLSESPEGKGTHKFVPWPNQNIVSLEFFPRNTSGGTEYR